MTEIKPEINSSRKRTNILKNVESKTITFLCKMMPNWVTSDMLTAIGFLGSIIVAIGLVMAKSEKPWLIVSVLGFAIQWFGDSLDGRLAYYRNTPRKWYGWALDISVDWVSIGIIGFGFYYFFDLNNFVAFLFIFTYGWSMINSLLKYKITNKYTIDTNLMGPTELRIIICIFILLEYFVDDILMIFGAVGSIILALINISDLVAILKEGNKLDDKERLEKRL